MTMTTKILTLTTAQTLAQNIYNATRIFESSTRSALQDYIDFLSKHVPGRAPEHCRDAHEYSFKEVDGSLFVFESEEFSHYGEWTTETIEMPFTFVGDPEKYKADIIQSIRDAEALRLVKSVSAAQDRVAKLKKDLAAAEATLERTKK